MSYYNGDFIFRNEFSYGNPVKDPSTARPGLPMYNWWFINEIPGPNAPLEQDQYVSDGAGGEFKIYDEDPAKTITTAATQHLEGSRFSYDNTFNIEYFQYWDYENCGGKNDMAKAAHKSVPKIDQRSKDIRYLRMPILMGSKGKQQLTERKAIIQRLKQ